MKKSEVTIPGVYAVKVSGRVVPVRLEEPHAYGGWVGVNLKTGRAVRIKTAAKLRYPWKIRDVEVDRVIGGAHAKGHEQKEPM